jgi:hypothetical protein
MKTLLFTILITMLFTLTVTAQDNWKENSIYSLSQSYKFDKWDKGLYTSFTAFQVTDFLQTNYIFEHPEKYRERFPIARWAYRNADDAGIIGCFVVSNYLVYKSAKHLKPVPRKILLFLAAGVEAYSTRHNYRDGVKFSYNFNF